jgi:hypothetical protein
LPTVLLDHSAALPSYRRVHLLAARTRAGYVAIDTASTNGTERDGRAVRAALLSESSALGYA